MSCVVIVVSLALVLGSVAAFTPITPQLCRLGTPKGTLQEDFDGVVMTTYGRYPITMVKGKGSTLTDDSGKTYLDFVAGIATCAVGHAHEGLAKAVTDQINKVHHVSNLYYIPEQGKLAAWLVKNSPMDRVFFCNSGAEANEAAIKLARKHAHTKLGIDQPVIITAESSFHGRTLATITATGQAKYQKNFGPLVPGFEYTPYNDAAKLRAAVKRINGKQGLLAKLKFWEKPKKRLAGILLECLQGEGGVRPGTKEFMKVTDENGKRQHIDMHKLKTLSR
jgi:acetylornithine aminotransferase